MVQSPLNDTTQPVAIEEEGQSPTIDRRWVSDDAVVTSASTVLVRMVMP